MLVQRQEVTAEQPRLIALAFGLADIAAVAFQCALAEVPAAFAINEAPRIAIILTQPIAVERGGAVHNQTRFFKIVIAPADPASAICHAYAEAVDGWCIRDLATAGPIGRRLAQLRKRRLVIAKHQHVTLCAVPKVIVDAFFFAQALQKVQVTLGVLHTVLALGINRWA